MGFKHFIGFTRPATAAEQAKILQAVGQGPANAKADSFMGVGYADSPWGGMAAHEDAAALEAAYLMAATVGAVSSPRGRVAAQIFSLANERHSLELLRGATREMQTAAREAGGKGWQ